MKTLARGFTIVVGLTLAILCWPLTLFLLAIGCIIGFVLILEYAWGTAFENSY